MKDLFLLSNKRILVTGGTRGIGRAISLAFAQAGASVIANHVRDADSAETLRGEAQTQGFDVEICRADLGSDKGIQKLIEFVNEKFPSLSGLVHCAATGVHKPLEQLDLRHFDWTYRLNVRAFFELVHRFLPRFEKGASILAISSEGAERAVPQYTLVGSSKGALESLARHFAAELAGKGIRVNILSAGTVLTEAWKVLPDSERRLAEAVRRSPIQRLVTADEVACAARFLCSDAAGGVVGHTMVVDGGLRIAG